MITHPPGISLLSYWRHLWTDAFKTSQPVKQPKTWCSQPDAAKHKLHKSAGDGASLKEAERMDKTDSDDAWLVLVLTNWQRARMVKNDQWPTDRQWRCGSDGWLCKHQWVGGKRDKRQTYTLPRASKPVPLTFIMHTAQTELGRQTDTQTDRDKNRERNQTAGAKTHKWSIGRSH